MRTELPLLVPGAHEPRRDDCFLASPGHPDTEGMREFILEFVKGDSTGVACPQCRSSEIVYNGNYFCSDAFDCGWAMCADEIPSCPACNELFNVCYLGLLRYRDGRDPRAEWVS